MSTVSLCAHFTNALFPGEVFCPLPFAHIQQRVTAVPMTWTVLVTQLPGLDRKLSLDSANLFECARRCCSFFLYSPLLVSLLLFFSSWLGAHWGCAAAQGFSPTSPRAQWIGPERRAASGGALAPEPPRATRGQPESIRTVFCTPESIRLVPQKHFFSKFSPPSLN